MKTCPHCKFRKRIEDFNKCISHKDGLATYCRPCVREIRNAWTAKNRDKVRDSDRARYWRNPELKREKAKAHYHRNRVIKTTRVYFVQGLQTRLIKIGKTRGTVEERLKDLQCASPDILRLLLSLDEEDEYKYHEQFKADRVHGEWFEPSDSLLKFIDDHCNILSL